MPFVPGRSRTRRAIAAVRHVFLEEDSDGPGLLAALTTRPDLPPPSYVLHSSPGRLHVFWRSRGFDAGAVETLQKRLARELDTDTAATSCAQTTRLPGFVNHKRQTPVTRSRIEYLRPRTVLEPTDFPVLTRPSSSDDRAASVRRVCICGQRSCGSRSSDFFGRSSLRLPDSTATFAHFESVVASCGDSSSPTRGDLRALTSGTHGVSLPGPNGSCWRRCRTRGDTAVNHSVVCSAATIER